MHQNDQASLINCLLNYNWPTIWKNVKDVRIESMQISSQNEMAIALKAMMLATHWFLKEESYALLAALPRKSNNNVVAFIKHYVYMSFADKTNMAAAKLDFTSNTPRWMSDWLAVEYSGRSLNFKQQANVVKKWTNLSQPIPETIIIGLLQSLDHDLADDRYLRNLMSTRGHLLKDTPVALALKILLDIPVEPELFARHQHHAVYLQAAKSAYRQGDANLALRHYDNYAQQGLLNENSLNRWLTLSLCTPSGLSCFIQRAQFALETIPDKLSIQGHVASRLFVYYWMTRDYANAFSCVQRFIAYKNLPRTQSNTVAQIFFNYTLKLCVAWEIQNEHYQARKDALVLHVIGESHCLSPSNRHIIINHKLFHAQGHIVMGIKMSHLASDKSSIYKSQFELWVATIPNDQALMITIGEIDLRPNEGVWKNSYLKTKPVEAVLIETINGYVAKLAKLFSERTDMTIIQGIPAPAYPVDAKSSKNPRAFLNMIAQANGLLKQKVLEQGWYFLDVYAATLDPKSQASNGRYHLDQNHLAPRYYDDINEYLVEGAKLGV